MTSGFQRDRFTWLAYVLLGYFAYMQGALSPIMPFLRAELGLSYTIAGLHFTAFAFGMVLAGATADRVVRFVGRRTLFWGGGAGMALGALLFSIMRIPALTILTTFLTGYLGAYLLVMIQAMLSDRHADLSAIALTESNLSASVFAALPPLIVGFGERIEIGWRLVIGMGVAVWLGAWLLNRLVVLPEARKFEADSRETRLASLPAQFWFYWLVIFVSVSVEWSIIFWSPDFLENVVRLPRETASATLSVFLVAMMVGRLGGSRLMYRIPPERALWLSIALVVLGFPLFWLGQTVAVNLLGFIIMGMGVANLFPLGLSIASRVGAAASDAASSRISLAAGSAILIMPQILGSLADIVGIFRAFGTVILLVAVLVVVNLRAQRLAASRSQA